MRAGGALLWICLLSGPAWLAAQEPNELTPPPPPEAMPEPPASEAKPLLGPPVAVRGVVLNALTGAPIPRVLISFTGNTETETGTLTDGEGRFELPSVPSGPVPFTAHKPGYLDKANADGDVANSDLVLVAAEMPELTFRLTPASSIEGRIELSTGDPGSEITVHLLKRALLDGRAIWEESSAGKTDVLGNYRFAGLAAGTYAVYTDPALESSEYNPFLRTAATLQTERSGYPSLFFPEAHDLAGAQKIRLQAGENATANFSLTLTPFHTVVVKVPLPKSNPEDENAEKAHVAILSREGSELPSQARFDAAGNTAQAILPDGNYTVLISAFPPVNRRRIEERIGATPPSQSSSLLGSLEITVTGHDLPGLSLPLQPQSPGSVQYTVRNRGAVKESNSHTPYPVLATLMAMPDGKWLGENNQFFASLQENGAAVSEALAPGDYWLTLNVADSGLCEDFVTANGASLARSPLHVALNGAMPPVAVGLRGDCASLDLALPPGLTALHAGEESFYTILVAPEFDSTSYRALVTLRPSSGGTAKLQDLTPGRYRIVELKNSEAVEYRNPAVLDSLSGKGQEITLEPNGSATLTVEVSGQ